MYSISQAVEQVIKVKPFVVEALSEGLINISSLARQINPAIERLTGKETKQGAIVMALNRMIPNLINSNHGYTRDILTMLGDIIVRSNLTDYTFRNSPSIFECHINLMNEIAGNHDVFYTMVRGVFESNLVVGSDLAGVVEKHFGKEVCTYRNENLSAITLKLPAGNVQAVGFYYQIMKFIAWEGINVKEVVSTTNEFSIIVEEDDVDRAFAILKNLKSSTKLG
ncbi:MAG: aspartate kinase [Marinilabiliaceae bacterium]|nr:aspartate kinase [Marinilabiliaceae bacterium]